MASKYPFTSLRKSLRLLIDDNPEALDEVENDISFVYSGYAPISVRLVQCVAQKGGVLSNPAEKEKDTRDSTAGGIGKSNIAKVQAHPIVGWKGFEDVLASIPGKTFDIVQKSSLDGPTPVASSRECSRYSHYIIDSSFAGRIDDDNSCIFFRWLYIHGDRCSEMG